MDDKLRSRAIWGLRNGPSLDLQAGNLCEMMASPPSELHEEEDKFEVTREGDFDLLLKAHHRKVRGVYSHVFVGESGEVRGRYQFFLEPMAIEILDVTPSPILTFLINSNGTFSVGGVELSCRAPGLHRSLTRNLIVTQIIACLQKAITIQVPEPK
ncbi:hypothetical protein [Massilia sp. DWR3-1-1]|uniref:hypothetical protein n=1 Tax=Massilia sp. DWR3-1-1 TaxID=2804559 RepID=UPI003CF1DCB3